MGETRFEVWRVRRKKPSVKRRERCLLCRARVYRRPKETHARRATRDDARRRESEREMPSFDNPMSPGGDDETLSRSYTKSSKKELLKQIRDAVNPNQREAERPPHSAGRTHQRGDDPSRDLRPPR